MPVKFFQILAGKLDTRFYNKPAVHESYQKLIGKDLFVSEFFISIFFPFFFLQRLS